MNAPTTKPQPKSKPIEPESDDLSGLIAEIEVMLDQLAHYQIRARLRAFREAVSAKDGQVYRIWKGCPRGALLSLRGKIAKEIEAFKPSPPPTVESDVSAKSDEFF